MENNQTSEERVWEEIHAGVKEKYNGAMCGVDNADLDWFLRDSNVTMAKHALNEDLGDGDSRIQQTKAGSLPSTMQQNSSQALPILSTQSVGANKARPSISSILEIEVHPKASQEFLTRAPTSDPSRRKSSGSSIGSVASDDSNTGATGFLSKLKSRLQRNDSSGTDSSLPEDLTSLVGSPKRENVSLKTQNLPIGLEFSTSKNDSAVLPAYGRPCPEHATEDSQLQEFIDFFSYTEKRRSCIKGQPTDNCIEEKPDLNHHQQPNQHSKLTSFLKRMAPSSLNTTSSELKSCKIPCSETDSEGSIVTYQKLIIPEFQNRKPLKHVAFHSRTFLIDPPQQIPSRNPRKGNVEILPSGVVRINPLTEADKLAVEKSLRGQGGGLVVGGTGALGLIEKDSQNANNETERIRSLETLTDFLNPDDPIRSSVINNMDKTMPRPATYSSPVKKMALDLMYIRCCHLREILPVPAILKQIPPGSTAPLPILQLRNPAPTTVEIQTFADFIRIAPVICISLDGVSLTIDQFELLLSAMRAKTQLEKLSLRNTPINNEGWLLLCWFLAQNKALNKLDITQCPPLSLNLLKKKKKNNTDESTMKRMKCNHENRTDMNWPMFTAALISRGGIEELILTGCCITDFRAFKCLIKRAASIKTFKLGLAYNQLSPLQLSVVLDSWFFSDISKGLDLGYNDFLSSTFLNVFLRYGKSEHINNPISNPQMRFLSLNATNLRFSETFKEFFDVFITKLPNLRYLDMSNNPELFGNTVRSDSTSSSSLDPTCEWFTEDTSIIQKRDDTKAYYEPKIDRGNSSFKSARGESRALDLLSGNETWTEPTCKSFSSEVINTFFCSRLPRFKSLARLHLDNSGLTSQNLSALFEIVPFCKALHYLSIIGNALDIYSANLLLQSLRYSVSLMRVDADFKDLPETMREKIGLYAMRNVDLFLKTNVSEGDEISGVDEKMHPMAGPISDELGRLLSMRDDEKLDIKASDVKNVLERIQNYRTWVQDAFNDLFASLYKRELNVEGKETLIRLLFVDSALERALKLVDDSLAGNDRSLLSTHIINMISAEDKYGRSKAFMMSNTQKPCVEDDGKSFPGRMESPSVSRQQSFTNLANLDKEEGSTLKLMRLGNQDLLKQFSTTSGLDLKAQLLKEDTSDLDAVIKNMSIAREGGIPR